MPNDSTPSSDPDGLDPIRQILYTDPIWAAYGLADLHPDFAPYCRWYRADSSLVLLYTGLKPPILLTVGPAIEAALALVPLPERVYLSIREAHHPVIARLYDIAVEPMYRMALAPERAGGIAASEGVRSLSPADAGRIAALYRHGGPFTPDAFDPYQLENGVFYGIFDEKEQLLAVGGTHAVNPLEGVAAIGNLYTHPDYRGRGYARAISRAIIAELQGRSIATIVLNVAQANTAARSLYESLGFVIHCPFIEGLGVIPARWS